MHDGRETRVGVVHQAAIPGPTALLLPDHGSPLFRDGIRERWGFDVPDTTVWQVQRACRCVSHPLSQRTSIDNVLRLKKKKKKILRYYYS